MTPDLFAHEIRDRLFLDGTCSGDNLPSMSSITRLVAGLRAENGQDFTSNEEKPKGRFFGQVHREKRIVIICYKLIFLSKMYV